jgi:tetratricopeptide (TPR) repeat protein
MRDVRHISCLLCFFLVACESLQAQDIELEKRLEEQRLRAVRLELDSAVILTDRGEYARADTKYLYALKNLKSVPSDLAYNFGRNSYMVGKYAQAIDWLNKYIQLKGVSGTYYDDAVTWLDKANAARLKERQEESSKVSSIVLSRNYDIECPTGKVNCPVCNGLTVTVKRTYLGETYKPCTTCSQKGYLSCADFNKLLRGELKPNP